MSAITHFAEKEYLKAGVAGTVGPEANCISISVPKALTRRQVYVFLQTFGPATQITFLGSVNLKKNDVPQAQLPLCIQQGMNASLAKTIVSMFTAGGSPVKDSISANFKTYAGLGVTSSVLQPVEIEAEIDTITVNVDTFNNPSNDCTGWFIYIACRSQEN